MTATFEHLATRKADANSRLAGLRAERGIAALEPGEALDRWHDAIQAAEAELESISEAEGALARQERAEASRKAAERLAASRAALVDVHHVRIEAMARAEAATRQLAHAIRDVEKATAAMRSLIIATGSTVPSDLDGQVARKRLGNRLALHLREAFFPNSMNLDRLKLGAPDPTMTAADDWVAKERALFDREFPNLKDAA